MQHNIPAAVGLRVEFQSPIQTAVAEVWVTLPAGQEAGTQVGRALALTPTPREPVPAVHWTVTKLLTEILALPAGTNLLAARLARVVAGNVGVTVFPLSSLAVALIQGRLLGFRVLLLRL